ncbi:MAG TPA: hypothetical protein VE570_06360 [Thermoleophilaceae bacterium]|nr:hypothetical protein [Thermoleophilaceae bacterium]
MSVGSTVPADKVPGKGEPQFINGRMIVAAGISPRVGRWRMYYASTNRGVCMGFEYVDTHSGLAEGCGNGGALTVGKWSIPHQEIALYGRAPAGASSIRVALRDGGVLRAQLFMAPEGIPGKFYFAGLPYERRPAAVQAFDKSDRPLGPLTDIP